MGENGSGKTTILWSLLLFCRGFNTLVTESNHYNNGQPKIQIKPQLLAMLLNYSALEHMEMIKVFQPCNATKQVLPKVTACINGTEVTCTLELNGGLSICPDPATLQKEKIRYAFVGIDSVWAGLYEQETVATELMSSGVPNMRQRYANLSTESKAHVADHMQKLLRIQQIFTKSSDIYVTEANGDDIDITLTGGACRKIFTAFVLLYSLIKCTEKTKIFLMEEPEVQLYPGLHQLFTMDILRIARDHKIQVVITTNSHLTMDLFNMKSIFVLDGTNSGNMASHSMLRDAVHLHLLGAKNKPVIICEGKHDVLFLSRMSDLFGKSLQDFHVVASSGKTAQINLALDIVRTVAKNERDVIVLADRDFHVNPYEDPTYAELFTKTNLIFWTLPSIESYLFVHLVAIGECNLDFLQSPEDSKQLAISFFDSFAQQNRADPTAHLANPELQGLFALWSTVGQLAQLPSASISIEDLKKVAKIVHGHTWVEQILQSATPVLINKTTKDIVNHCAEIGEILELLIDAKKRKEHLTSIRQDRATQNAERDARIKERQKIRAEQAEKEEVNPKSEKQVAKEKLQNGLQTLQKKSDDIQKSMANLRDQLSKLEVT